MGREAAGSSSAQQQQQPSNVVQHSPWSLVFKDPLLEDGFRRQQCVVWAALELRNLYLNLAAGVINFTITMLIQGSLFTVTGSGSKGMLVYMTVAVLHWFLAAHWHLWPRYRGLSNLLLEACYSTICTLSMPTWVVHGTIDDVKAFVRQFVLGSGILIGYWCRFLTPTFFFNARWIIPLQFLFQARQLTEPTCSAITASSGGMQSVQRLSLLLDRFAGTTLESCPVSSCHNLVYMLQLLTGGTLLYVQYRMEGYNRRAYLQSRGACVMRYWPHVPGYVQAVLHGVVYLQLFVVAWVVLQCSAAS